VDAVEAAETASAAVDAAATSVEAGGPANVPAAGPDAPAQATDWIEIGPLDAIPRLGARLVRIGACDIAVFRTRDDRVFALADRCPHRGGPLSQGIVTGCRVICPLHDWSIGLEDGRAAPPDEGAVRRFPARVVDGVVYLAT
jgi:nitrite reductase (NADH) small subunit